MKQNVLVINAGSSSLKYQLIDMGEQTLIAKGLVERIGMDGSILTHKPVGKEPAKIKMDMRDHNVAIQAVLDALTDKTHGVIADMSEINAIGHRIVHGGESFKSSAIITQEVLDAIKENAPLAPLHNPANIMGIEACQKVLPNTTQVAVFDTAFHQTMPPEAYMYALPYDYYSEKKIRRYGFHGTSHLYVSRRAAEILGKPVEQLKIITCHLGNGSSVAAVKNGKSIDTSMGFTPLEGVPMGTRSGSIDPAIIFHLIEQYSMTVDEVNDLLNKQSGMHGISGISSDFRDLNDAADAGNARGKLALDMFCYSVKKYIGAYAAVMGGVDAVVFTAGVGENDAYVREHAIEGLEFLGIKMDVSKNNVRGQEVDLTAEGASVKVLIVPTNEELKIAQDTVAAIS
ncbi:acetate kinase [Clostridia bacterium OttesenSCG-928-F22]|nr:acetate kinase [Clostridia bacterium OttesenSCG-928-F22]